MALRYITGIMFLLFNSIQLQAQDAPVSVHTKAPTIQLAAPHITSLIEEGQKGIYQQIMAQALSELNIKTQQYYSPYKRALLSFERQTVDCIYSFTNVMQNKLGKKNIIYSFPLGAFSYFIFTPRDKEAIIDPAQLENLSVGAVYGHENYYQHRLTSKTKLLMVNNDKQNLKKLSLKRIDALIGALPDLMPYLKELNFSPLHPLVESYDRITCHKNKDNREFLRQLSEKLEELKLKGIYRDIAKDFYFEFDNEKAKQQYN